MKTIKTCIVRAASLTLTLAAMLSVAFAAEAAEPSPDPFLDWPEGVATGWGTEWRVPEGTLPPPAEPPAFELGPVHKTSFRVSIDGDVPGAFWYEYRYQAGRYPEGGVGVRMPAPLSTGKVTDSITGLKQDTAYFVQVRSCNGGGCSDWSENSASASVTTLKHRDGSIRHPWASGEWVSFGDWSFGINSYLQGDDAWWLLREENQFNDPPLRGNEYYLLWVHAAYYGEGQDSLFGFTFSGITPSGVVSDRCGAVVIPQELDEGSYISGSQKAGFVCVEGKIGTPLNLLIQEMWADSGPGFAVIEPNPDYRCSRSGGEYSCPDTG